MTKRTTPFSPEVRARAVRMVREHEGEHGSQWSAIQSIDVAASCPERAELHGEVLIEGTDA